MAEQAEAIKARLAAFRGEAQVAKVRLVTLTTETATTGATWPPLPTGPPLSLRRGRL
jgi:hypothetical protein